MWPDSADLRGKDRDELRALSERCHLLTSALYRLAGGVPPTFECPPGVGTNDTRPPELHEILDIQLTLCRQMTQFALEL